ncbi:hypothetical protein AX769_19880 [Frondihabitans sp. PAMC 28766]|uniref:hypothetical protein n=1 Tax=Frondihabitans sp. PAMC 28766 TaxID=1795630 RepID=UPI00078E94C9|nr:hypothetical protein [Frondihabitans sp. PAMC 28766]AMM21992.1 hypothetical protein AX769_19880 [Frondihabitans sp. PAMC 28766]
MTETVLVRERASRALGSLAVPATASRLIAIIAVVLIPLRVTLPHEVPISLVISVILAPLWVPAVARFRLMRLVLAGGLVTLASGFVLALAHQSTNGVDRTSLISYLLLLLNLITSIGVVLWARTVLDTRTVALVFGVGLVLGIVPLDSQFSENPWKFSFAFPVAVVALALAQRFRSWWVELLVLLVLLAYSATHDFRSMFGQMLLAAAILAAQVPLKRFGRKGSAARIIVGLGVLAILVYNAGQALILDGALGAATQARSIAQIDTSGSLIVGGRPELAATLALMRQDPAGFGLGVNLTPDQLLTAKSGMASIGYAPNNGYVENFMFGGHIELHSVVGDLWAHFGVVGFAYALLLAVVMVWFLAKNIAERHATGLMLFAVAQSLWFLPFGPLLSSRTSIVLAIGLVALPVVSATRDGATRHHRYVKEPEWPTTKPIDPGESSPALP